MRRLVVLAGRIMVAFLLMSIFYPVIAATFVDNSPGTFIGTHNNTQWNTDRVELTSAGMTTGNGTYTSEVKDASSTAIWNTIAWSETLPYKEELPDNKGSDSGANMSNNVLLMHMNETSGTTIFDTSGESPANNGTTFNSPTLGAIGKYNTALSFDGTDDYARVPDANSLDNTNQLTIEAWVYPTSLTGFRGIICKREGILAVVGQNAYGVYFSGNKLSADIDGPDARISTTTFTTNRWYHIVVVYDGTLAAAQRVRMYVNGSLDSTHSESSASIPNRTSRLYIGTLPVLGNPLFFFSGRMDEVAVHKGYSMSGLDVLNHYKRGVLNLRLRVRSCNDPACSGESWSGFYTTPGPNTLSQFNNRYFQYRARFDTEDPNYTPELQSVTIDYDLAEATPVLSVGSPTSCPNQMTLTWSGAIPPVGRTISSYNIYRGTSPGVDTSGAPYANTPSSPYTDTAVSSFPGATYYYKVRAVYDDASLGLESNEDSGTTIDCVGTAPVLTASDSTGCPNSIVLTWTAATPPLGNSVTGYDVYRSLTSPVPTTTPYASPGNVLTYTDNGVSTTPQTHYYLVRANFSNATYLDSGEDSAVTLDCVGTGATLSVTSSTTCPNQMTLTWSGAIPPVGRTISSYNIYRGTSPGVDTSGAPYANMPSSPYADTAVSSFPGVTYYYKVRAVYDDASLGLESNENSGTTVDCVGTAPVLTATPTSNCPNRIDLSWTAATPPVGRTILGYNIYRSQTSPVNASGVPYASLGDVLAYQDANVPSVSGFTYYYVVRARYTDSTLGLESNEDSASTLLFCQRPEPETYKNYMNNMSALASNKLSCCENEQAYALLKMAQEKGLAGTEEYLEAGKLIRQAEEYCVKAKQFYSGKNYVASNYCSSKACEFYKKAIAILEKLLAP